MSRAQIFALVLALCTLNGLFSGLVIIPVAHATAWLPAWLPPTLGLLLFLGSLIVATTTLLVSGVPAALAEGAFPQLRGTAAAMWIWAGSAFVLSWYGVAGFLRIVLGGT